MYFIDFLFLYRLNLMCRYTYICVVHVYIYIYASLVVQTVKNLPEMQETQVQSLGWEDPLEKGMATHSSILAWKFDGQKSLTSYSS